MRINTISVDFRKGKKKKNRNKPVSRFLYN